MDIVIPNKNEKEFLAMAERLGYTRLIFLYPSQKDIPSLSSQTMNIQFGILTQKGGKGTYVTLVKSAENDQHILEHTPPNIMYGFETQEQRDFLHQRASGLNQVLCTLAHKNNVIITFSFNDVLKTFKHRRAQILGRIMQNIHLCRKYDVITAIASFATNPYEMRSPRDLQSFYQELGMHPMEAKKAMESLARN